ncbi:uncharacterized protein LOC135676500 isoform X2 [Musa acuminata AAA Group]|uniref:uncharacterized protein LOC135676500 isoform X2 n=1 Tax=Musa acuminata AAA Group TaxID=214697 RepID=UPI0031CFD7A1
MLDRSALIDVQFGYITVHSSIQFDNLDGYSEDKAAHATSAGFLSTSMCACMSINVYMSMYKPKRTNPRNTGPFPFQRHWKTLSDLLGEQEALVDESVSFSCIDPIQVPQVRIMDLERSVMAHGKAAPAVQASFLAVSLTLLFPLLDFYDFLHGSFTELFSVSLEEESGVGGGLLVGS